jgi:cytochrome b561
MRQALGWGVIVGSDVAFTFGAFYEFIPPGADREWTTLFLHTGLGLTLVVLALFLGRRLVDLFSAGGRWAGEETPR